MAAALLPPDVTEHLTAAIQLSNRHIQLRILEEAETLLTFEFPAAAILVAGVVREFLVAGQRNQAVGPDEQQRIEKWTKLRNDAVHSPGRTVTLDETKDMLAGVRQLLLRATSPRLASTASSHVSPGPVRGKYRFVRTTSGEFITRKADEQRLEH